MRVRLRELDAKTFVPHDVHRRERVWAESNCYVDLWLELLHGLGLDPVPCLAFTIGLDFEGDQLTFFKMPHADLRRMYGIDVIELNVWRTLAFHVREQVAMGRAPIVEIDSWYLPDTAGVSYRLEHTKSSIAIQDIDLEARTLGYFHGQGYHELAGDDFDCALRRVPPHDAPDRLAPYFEVVKLDRVERVAPAAQATRAIALLREHLALRPRENPLAKMAVRFPDDLAWMREQPLASYHTWAFATLRQAGASFELCAVFLRWLAAQGQDDLEEVAQASDAIAQASRTLMLKVARAVNGKRPLDASEPLDAMANGWETVIRGLDKRYR